MYQCISDSQFLDWKITTSPKATVQRRHPLLPDCQSATESWWRALEPLTLKPSLLGCYSYKVADAGRQRWIGPLTVELQRLEGDGRAEDGADLLQLLGVARHEGHRLREHPRRCRHRAVVGCSPLSTSSAGYGAGSRRYECGGDDGGEG